MTFLRVLGLGAEMQGRHLMTERFVVFTALAQPVFIAITASYVLGRQEGSDAMRLVAGIGLAGLWSVLLFTSGAVLTYERAQGTLELLAASPTPFVVTISGKLFANSILGLTAFPLAAGVVGSLFGHALPVANWGAFAIAMVVGVWTQWSLGMAIAPASIAWPAAQRFAYALEYPVYIVAGLIVPIDVLPSWLRPVAFALPPYWVLQALHSAAVEGPAWSGIFVGSLLAATSLGGVALALSAWMFRRMLVRAHRDGTLSLG